MFKPIPWNSLTQDQVKLVSAMLEYSGILLVEEEDDAYARLAQAQNVLEGIKQLLRDTSLASWNIYGEDFARFQQRVNQTYEMVAGSIRQASQSHWNMSLDVFQSASREGTSLQNAALFSLTMSGVFVVAVGALIEEDFLPLWKEGILSSEHNVPAVLKEWLRDNRETIKK